MLRYILVLRRYAVKKAFRFSQKQLVDIYKIALDSFLPKENAINVNNIDYLAIDMTNTNFDNISQESKQEILNYFKDKYSIEVINASIDILKESGLTSDIGNDTNLISKDKKGVLLGILNISVKSKTEVIIEGYWFFTSVASEGIRTTIVLKDKEWHLQKTDVIWMS